MYSAAHHWAYTTSKVLHRDLSMNNIMWFMRGDALVGVLCDWDLAEDQSDDRRRAIGVSQFAVTAPSVKGTGNGISMRGSESSTSKSSDGQSDGKEATGPETQVQARYRTGTGPFMALDLLSVDEDEAPPPHKYRFDLESLFYIYACAAGTYNPDSYHKYGALPQWDKVDLAAIGDNKRKFLTKEKLLQQVIATAHPDSKAVMESSLRKLWDLFGEVLAITIFRDGEKLLAQKKMSETLAQSRDLDEAAESKRDAVATYEAFMAALGEPLDAE